MPLEVVEKVDNNLKRMEIKIKERVIITIEILCNSKRTTGAGLITEKIQSRIK